ncbi:hypothetical protein D9615_001592 [Tricholomella constricta]|uniref:DUF6534 domain-containing protein n=1 Tax=Tricholomella constricta TaxID=117010 RepID=A0A8H5MAG0_9AGAR|nr:hypothetical protein D9615_001592 [Tricholomella constricta]
MSEHAPPPGPSGIPPGLDIGRLIGPQLIGALMNYALWGILAVQVYLYHLSFPRDNRLIKWLVYFTFVFETTQTCLNGVDIFEWYAAGFGNLAGIANPRLSTIYTPIMGSVMALVVQAFFCYRIWVINRSSWWWCLLIAAVSVIQAVAGFVGGVKAHVVKDITKRHDQTVLVYLWLIGDVVADIMIAATMSFSLLRASPGKHKQTNNVVTQIDIRCSAAVAIISLALFLGAPGTTYFTCPTLILGKLYANTLLVTFNNRAFLANKMKTSHLASSTTAYSARMAMQGSSARQEHIPLSAGLKFSENEDTQDNVEHVMITQQSATIGADTENNFSYFKNVQFEA